ncbi:MAG: hypothetical protein JW751_31270, partial [Polyangiaceae bacterium]|nr:hypothetical protein [Polyangiaceae bacterium]
RRVDAAKFPEVNTIDGFDFDFSPCRKKIRIPELREGEPLDRCCPARFRRGHPTRCRTRP